MQGKIGPRRIGKQIGKAVNPRNGGKIAIPGKAGAWGARRSRLSESAEAPGMTPLRWRLGRALWLAGMLAAASGCLSLCHPVDFPSPERAAPSAAVPQCARNHVHIFLIHGLDPLDFANLEGVTAYCQQLGYIKTHYGQLYHLWKFKKDLRKVHEEDRDARFVLIGFSFGANMVRELANAVKDDGIVIDLLVYLGGNTLENTPPNQPDHVIHIVNILATGCIWNGCTMDRADNRHYDNVWHFGSPTHPQTLDLLGRELAVVASRVPVRLPTAPPLTPEDELPRPRPLAPQGEELPAPRPVVPPN